MLLILLFTAVVDYVWVGMDFVLESDIQHGFYVLDI